MNFLLAAPPPAHQQCTPMKAAVKRQARRSRSKIGPAYTRHSQGTRAGESRKPAVFPRRFGESHRERLRVNRSSTFCHSSRCNPVGRDAAAGAVWPVPVDLHGMKEKWTAGRIHADEPSMHSSFPEDSRRSNVPCAPICRPGFVHKPHVAIAISF